MQCDAVSSSQQVLFPLGLIPQAQRALALDRSLSITSADPALRRAVWSPP